MAAQYQSGEARITSGRRGEQDDWWNHGSLGVEMVALVIPLYGRITALSGPQRRHEISAPSSSG